MRARHCRRRQPRPHCHVGIVGVAAGRRRDRARHVGGIKRAQQQAPAARADGGQFAPRCVADEQQQRARRRLLQNFQQRIGAFALQIVHRIDDGDAPAALARGRAEKSDRAPHVVDADHGIEFAGLLIDDALQHQQIALRLGGDAARHRMVRHRGQATWPFAPPAPSDPDARARNAPADRPVSPCRCRAGRRSARRAECGRAGSSQAAFARRRRGRTARKFRAGAKRRALDRGPARRSRRCTLRQDRLFGVQLVFDRIPDAVGHHIARSAAVHHNAAFRFFFRQPLIGLAQFLMKLDRLAFETIGFAFAAPLGGAGKADRSPERRE